MYHPSPDLYIEDDTLNAIETVILKDIKFWRYYRCFSVYILFNLYEYFGNFVEAVR